MALLEVYFSIMIQSVGVRKIDENQNMARDWG